MSKALKLLIAGILGLFAAITAVAFLSSKESAISQSQQLKTVYVATENIRRGTTISKDQLAARSIPEGFIQPGASTKVEEVVDKVARTDILANEQFLSTKLASVGDETLAGVIIEAEEMRGVSVAVSAVSGLAGLVNPGDRVDVLGVFEVTEGNAKYTEVRLLEPAMLVLAVDKNLQPPSAAPKAQGGAGPAEGGGGGMITFYASTRQAQKLILAQRLGEISLLMRHSGDVSPLNLPIYDSRLLMSGKALWAESHEEAGLGGRPGALKNMPNFR